MKDREGTEDTLSVPQWNEWMGSLGRRKKGTHSLIQMAGLAGWHDMVGGVGGSLSMVQHQSEGKKRKEV